MTDPKCLTCGTESFALDALFSKTNELQYSTTEKQAEWWYGKSIWSSLPPQITCNEKYKKGWKPFSPQGDNLLTISFDAQDIQLDANGAFAYWAAEPSDTVNPASEAYGSFENSGITSCDQGRCSLKIRTPHSYQVEGTVFDPHVHLVKWDKDHWDTQVHALSWKAECGNL